MELYQFLKREYEENKEGILNDFTFEEFVESFMMANFKCNGGWNELYLTYDPHEESSMEDNYLGINFKYTYKIENERIIYPIICKEEM